ncbi:hypothetical protein BY996DRAFT_8393154 [Phakopsora pachyrhizi]|nr:hypothetical protein BY996DRAFT_8393154 [Phakopsora pachyrhizi]
MGGTGARPERERTDVWLGNKSGKAMAFGGMVEAIVIGRVSRREIVVMRIRSRSQSGRRIGSQPGSADWAWAMTAGSLLKSLPKPLSWLEDNGFFAESFPASNSSLFIHIRLY